MQKILTATILITIILITTTFAYAEVSDIGEIRKVNALSKITVSKLMFPKVRRTSATSLQLKWKRVSGVKGYVIYRYNKSKKKYGRVKTINNRTFTKWTDRKLERDKTYKYRLRSYKRINGKKVYSGYTYSISAKTYSKSAKKVNAGSITAKSSITIGLASKSAIKVKIKPSKFGNAKKKSVISKRIRFVSANSKVVIDGKKGKLSPRKPGTTNVYAVAHNGNLKKIKVKVVDYAKPAFWKNTDEISVEFRQILDKCSDNMKEIASYFSIHPKSQNSTFYINQNGQLINENNVPISGLQSTLMEFFKDSPYDIVIIVTHEGISFESTFGNNTDPYYEAIQFNFSEDLSENEANKLQLIKLAKYWLYFTFAGV
jgi:hypothetical protein